MRRNLIVTILAAAVLASFFSACGSAPEAAKTAAGKPAEAPPDWVLNPPESDAQYMYFTGSGESKSGSMAEGEKIARGALLDEIMRFLGVRITSETTATARASLDSFQADVVQQLTSKSSGRVAGLEIGERWVAQREGSVTVYLLARYGKSDLLKEKKRLEDIFREKIEAVSGPEMQAKELEAEGLFYQAALRYIDAAAAAFKSELENADIKFERNLNQAKEAVRRIGLVKLNDNLRAYVGKDFDQGFTLKVVAGSSAADPGLAGVAIRVAYKEMKATGKSAVRSRVIKTDGKGVAVFNAPAPEYVGTEQLTMALDMGEALEALADVPDHLAGQVDGLEQLVRAKNVSFSFESLSMATQISMGIAVFDLDASGNPLSMSETSAGLLGQLSQANFKVTPLQAAAGSVAERQDSQVIAYLASSFQAQVERAIFGTARITDHAQEGGSAIIQVAGTVKVVELASGKILLTVNKTKRAQGSNASAALSTAFKKLGEDIGQAIINQLR